MSIRAGTWIFLGEFRGVFLTGALLFLPSLPLLRFTQAGNVCSSGLCTSQITPWGVITGIYLYDGPINVMMFILVASMFISLTGWQSHEERKRRSLCMLLSSFIAAVLANWLWMLATPSTLSGSILHIHNSYGQSGVVYGVLGTFIAGLLTSAFPKGHSGAEVRAYFASKANTYAFVLGIAGLVCMLVIALFSPDLLFGSPQNFNVFVHEVAFGISFSLSLLVCLLGRLRIDMPWRFRLRN